MHRLAREVRAFPIRSLAEPDERPVVRRFVANVFRSGTSALRSGARRSTASLAFLAAACVSLSSLVGCGASTFDGHSFRGKGMAFEVGPQPESWHRLNADHGLLAFRDEGRDATIAVNGRCGKDGDDVPLSALTGHLFLRFTERETVDEKLFAFDGREALLTVLVAKLDGVRMKFATVVTKKDGCVYDFVLITQPETYPSVEPEFRQFYGGFHAEARE